MTYLSKSNIVYNNSNKIGKKQITDGMFTGLH